MSSFNYAGSDCLGGCGKRVLNRLQTCHQCRKKECKICKKVFIMNMHRKDVCTQCANKNHTTASKYASNQGFT